MLMTNAIKPTKITIKKVESEWYNYFNTLNEITRLREEITNPFDEEPDNNTGGGVNSVRNISDPTAKMATRLMTRDRKSTRLNSSHVAISYAVFCLKKTRQLP